MLKSGGFGLFRDKIQRLMEIPTLLLLLSSLQGKAVRLQRTWVGMVVKTRWLPCFLKISRLKNSPFFEEQ